MTATLNTTNEVTFCQVIVNDQDYTAEYWVMLDGSELVNEWCYGDNTAGSGVDMPVTAYLVEYPGRTWLIEMARRDYASAYPTSTEPTPTITVVEPPSFVPTLTNNDVCQCGNKECYGTIESFIDGHQAQADIALAVYSQLRRDGIETWDVAYKLGSTRMYAAWEIVEQTAWKLPENRNEAFEIFSLNDGQIYKTYAKPVHKNNCCECPDFCYRSDKLTGGWCKHALAALILYYAAMLFKQEHSRPAESVAA